VATGCNRHARQPQLLITQRTHAAAGSAHQAVDSVGSESNGHLGNLRRRTVSSEAAHWLTNRSGAADEGIGIRGAAEPASGGRSCCCQLLLPWPCFDRIECGQRLESEGRRKEKEKSGGEGKWIAAPPSASAHCDGTRCAALPPTASAPHADTAEGEVGQTHWQWHAQQRRSAATWAVAAAIDGQAVEEQRRDQTASS
jgi:hypothetical protein